MSRLDVFWWNEQSNFGDAMNPLLLERLFAVRVRWAPLEAADLTACGSVIQWITPHADARRRPISVWGSGFIFDKEPPPPLESVSYHAVRGPLSRQLAGADPTVPLGDPGLLVSQAVERSPGKRWRFGVVPHLSHLGLPATHGLVEQNAARLIDVRQDPAVVLAEISSCDYIFSSSLHGLVAADSYGIPNQWVTHGDLPFGGTFKFRDYYASFGLSEAPHTYDGNTDLTSLTADLDAGYTRPGLEEQQRQLIEAFPPALG